MRRGVRLLGRRLASEAIRHAPRWADAGVRSPARAALALAALAVCFAASGESPPNIVLIVADDLGYADLSLNGAADVETPNIDGLARQGVVFANGYAPYPVCSPSRAGLMTGRYPSRFGMETNLGYAPTDALYGLPQEETTLADYLRQAGYRTGAIGKWHLGAAPPFHPLNRGFDAWYGFLGGGHDYFRTDATVHATEEYLAPIGDGRGMTGFEGYLTDRLTDRAIEFALERSDQPFFLYLAYNAPHSPLQAPAALIEKHGHVQQTERRAYLAMVDALDQNVGRLIAALQASGRWRDTLTFFLSDNGGFARWANGGAFRDQKGSFHEGGIRVPFLAAWPRRWPAGETFQPMAIGLDVAATALALAGVEADASRPLDGVNLDPFVRGERSGSPHETLFWRAVWAGDPPRARFAARAGDLKLVKDEAQGAAALFNLRDDPSEARDILSESAAAARQLARRWNEWNLGNAAAAMPWMGHYRRHIDRATVGFHRQTFKDDQLTPAFQIGKPPRPRDISPPAAPADFAAMPHRSALALSWRDPQDRRVIRYQYRLRAVTAAHWEPWQEIDAWWELAEHRVGGLIGGVAYRLQLRAANGGGWGPPSEASATPE